MTTVKDIAKFSPTEQQRKWVDDECKKTKESQATVMRKLIQEKIDRVSQSSFDPRLLTVRAR